MASNEKSILDKSDVIRIKLKNKKVLIDNNLEDNWRIGRGGEQCRYKNWGTHRHEHQRSDIEGNWRTKSVENPERNVRDSWISTRDHKGSSEILKKEEVYSKTEVNGCWRIKSMRWKESEDIWNAVGELHIEQPYLFPVPPRRWSINSNRSIEFIEAFTLPSCKKTEIKDAADAIRKKVYFPFVMLYIEAPIEDFKVQKYQHTPENEMYEIRNKLWKIVITEDDPIESSNKDESSSKECETSLSLGAELDRLGSSGENDYFAGSSSINKALSPSKVIDQDYIYFPPTEDAIAKMRSSLGGKWLVYAGFDLANQDDMWTKLLPLCTEGVLIGMKASTAMITDAQEFMGGEAILCYTADANDMNDVKKAGDAIRNVLRMYVTISKCMLYYKTNASSVEGRYKKDGCLSVTSYMHTVK